MTTTSGRLGWNIRDDGSRLPDHELEDVVLGQKETAERVCGMTAGDLVVQCLCHGLFQGTPTAAVDWPTFEGAVLQTLAVELKCLTMAIAGESPDYDAPELLELTEEELSKMLHALGRRAEAAVDQELVTLRAARIVVASSKNLVGVVPDHDEVALIPYRADSHNLEKG